MRATRFTVLLVALTVAFSAAGQTRAPGAHGVQGPFTQPSREDPAAISLGYLRDRRSAMGLAIADVGEMVVRDRHVTTRTGVTHLYLRQQIGGIDIFKAGAIAAVDREGRLVSLRDRMVRRARSRAPSRVPAISAARAVASAAAHLGLAPAGRFTSVRRSGGPVRSVTFAPGGLSRDEIPVELQFVPMNDQLVLTWNVVIRTTDGLHWWNLHVDAVTGTVLRKDDWIVRDTYNVFPVPLASPDEGPRSIQTNPADATASPFGWHDTNGVSGAEFTDTRGNNVVAQEDADANDSGGHRPNGGAGLAFDFPLDLNQQPSGYRDTSIANLFYWNNIIHDVLYHYGFDEAAGNFQTNNYGNGGSGGDPVQADAQDGSDVNNAQMGTPPDGFDPRMEMFRWEQSPSRRLDVSSPPAIAGTYPVGKALFGYGTTGLAGTVVQALDPADGAGPSTTDGCSMFTNPGAISGNIAIIDRGVCTFVTKVSNAQAAGAIGVIIVNNAGNTLVDMAGVDPLITIPSVFVTQSDGGAIEAQLGSGVGATLVQPADRDSALDNGVIVHEYVHGLTNRLTGGASTVSCLDNAESGGMGEGWSDWYALVFTADAADLSTDAREMAPYLIGQPPAGPGIRNFAYSTDLGISPLTYADIATLNQPHGVGEVWAAALWETYWNLVDVYGFDPDLVAGSGGNNLSLELVTDALKLQLCDPTMVNGRTAILAADTVANASANRCLIWEGFAKRGLGVSANDGGTSNNLNVTEAFDIPVLGLTVVETDPFQESVIDTRPTDFTLHFSTPFVPGSLDAADLTINGQPAN
ncbi:MAG: M36 family metallopeptidase, partial [Myxococcota bacterium]